MGDGGQTYGGLTDVPDGMLCDNGNPSGCNFMQVRGPTLLGKPCWLTETNANTHTRAARIVAPTRSEGLRGGAGS